MERRIFLDAFYMTEKTLDKHIITLRKFKPEFILAITSAIYLMAQYMQKRGIDDIKPKAILTSCEVLFDHQRDIIENAFGCKVFDFYSGRDTSLHAAECAEHSGYHLTIENAIAEFVKNDENVASGESGKIIITDLSNYAMPFIRYEIGDMGTPLDERCSCGRGLPLMKSIEGRTSDNLRRTDGGYVTGSCLTIAVKDLKNLRQIQIIQKTKVKVILKVVKRENYTAKDSESLKKIMKSHLGDDMDIEIIFVDSILPTRSGKHRFAISEIEVDI
jgi:phenylacetate-CoA ligase